GIRDKLVTGVQTCALPILAGAVLIYLVIKTLLVEAFRIPSGSMIPTLMVGDWLFVNKVAYGPHIPFTNARLPGYHTPAHGDVVEIGRASCRERGESGRAGE